jgi:superkiller protein 3
MAVSGLAGGAVKAQSGKTVAEQMLNGAANAKPASEKKAGKAKPAPAAANRRQPPKRQKPVTAKANETAALHDVTFTIGVPGLELYLDGKKIGDIDNKGKISVKIGSGTHQLVAKKDDQQVAVIFPIIVSETQTSFDFSSQINKGIAALLKEPKIDEKKQAINDSVSVEAVWEAYGDPQRTSTVTLKDWQAIYKQSLNKMVAGNTSNQIEAQQSFAKGQIEMAAGNYAPAISAFSAAIVFLPDSAIVHYGLGNAYLAAGRTNEAASSYQRAIQLDGKFAMAYKQMGDVLAAQRKNKEAIVFYQKAKDLGMTSPDLRLNLATTQIKQNNCNSAVKELEALQTDSPSAGVYLALGECYLELKRSVSAIEALNKAIELEPNSPSAHFKIGEVYLAQNEYGKAKESLEKALAFDVEGKTINRKRVEELIEKARKKAR